MLPWESSTSFSVSSLSGMNSVNLYSTTPLIFKPWITPTWPLHNQHPPPQNPTTMKKMILMHRETGGLLQPISIHRQRGSAVIYMLMVLVENGARAGGHAVLLVKEAFEGSQRGTYNHFVWKTICWTSSGPTSRSIYTVLNQTCPLDAPSLL